MNTKQADNEWKVIKLEDLPEGVPVLAVTEMPNKSFASFHLTEYVLFPISGVFPKSQYIKPEKNLERLNETEK